ncbi:MAG: TonB C-terminal domain-containing protein [Candidatus Acidiferrales bacterium]|jgi:TonB family protein
MIPRTLVPVNVRPVTPDEAKKTGHRTTTYMDDRTVIPSGPSDAPPLDGKSTIPAHFPLGVLVNRTLVARGMPAKPFENFTPVSDTIPLDILDSRVVVPAYVEPAAPEDQKEFEHRREMTADLREVIEPDIFMTGDANLLMEPEEKHDARWDLVTRTLSVLVHVGLIIFLIFAPKIFPAHVPTQEETEMARQQLTYLLPPEAPAPRTPPAPKLRITPKTLNRVAPVEPPPQPSPTPAPAVPTPKPPAELPDAPIPHVPVAPPQQTQPAPSQLEPMRPAPQQNHLNLQLPSASLHDQLQEAIEHNTGSGIQVPNGPGIPGGPSGPGGPGMQPGATILTPTEGVDFSSYIQRLLATLKRNWYVVMPESAMMGDKGMVDTTFQINRDGSVPSPDPLLERTSGKGPLDNAAMSAIRASNPFEPLPSQFKGPYIRLRIVFLYNLPLEYAK